MEENQNQTNKVGQSMPSISGLMVKDVDGKFKVLADGELKELETMLAATEVTPVTQHGALEEMTRAVDIPKFTDLATIPEESHFREPEKTPEPGVKADLHFHPDDKAEVERELDKLTTVFNLMPQKKYSIFKICQKLIEKHSLTLQENDKKAFASILLSFFRQSRNSIDTRSMLMESTANGGVGLSGEIADKVLMIVKHLKEKIEETDGIVVDEEAPIIPKSEQPATATSMRPRITMPTQQDAATSSFAQETEQKKPAPETPVSMPVLPTVDVSATQSNSPSAPVAGSGSSPEVLLPKIEEAMKPVQEQPLAEAKQAVEVSAADTSKPSAPTQNIEASQPPETPTRPSISEPIRPVDEISSTLPKVVRPSVAPAGPVVEDVKYKERPISRSKPMGRVEELALMDLTMWRMLDADPRVRAGKILGRIQNLEQESLIRKSQGIDAWRNSDVYQRYLVIGQRSLEEGKDVTKVIEELQAEGNPTLTLDEFDAISDLNRMLRF